MYDAIVVGGGPSGMFAAIGAKDENTKVLLIEKNNTLGNKMKISGGGRCNLSNTSDIDNLIKNIPGNGRFLYSALNQFSNNDVINFFENTLGVKTKVEDRGRVFPMDDNSKTLIDSLHSYLEKIGVDIIFNSTVKELIINNNKAEGVILEYNQKIIGRSIILATGGVSYPKTGSTGDGHFIAKAAGHHITDLFPSSVPLLSEDYAIKERLLQGISLRNVEISLYDSLNKLIKKEQGDMIFTHFGLSGPAILRISRYVYLTQLNNNKPLKLLIDILPDIGEIELTDDITKIITENSKKQLFNGFKGLLPEKLLLVIINMITDNPEKKLIELSIKEKQELVNLIKKFPVNVVGTKQLKEAIVTGGGINIKEINPKTLESKLIEGLFFVGELIDIDAYTGGFNMQVAFSTGFVAGKSAKYHSQSY